MLAAAVVLAAPAARVDAADGPQTFEAKVKVEWRDRTGGHQVHLDVVSAGGVVKVSGPETVVAAPDARFLQDEAGWSLLWPGQAARPGAPAMSAKYQVARAPGPSVAGRPTTEVTVRERGAVVESMAVDRDTGLVLRRQLFDGAGAVARLVEVEELRMGTARTATTTPTAARRASLHLLGEGRVPAPFAAPARLAGDFVRVAAYQRGHTVHVLYSDGLHALSVFAEAGRLGRLPAGGERISVGEGKGYRYAWPGGDVLMWEAGGIVYTAVGDAPADDVRAAAASMPSARPLPLDDWVRRASRRLVEALTGGA